MAVAETTETERSKTSLSGNASKLEGARGRPIIELGGYRARKPLVSTIPLPAGETRTEGGVGSVGSGSLKGEVSVAGERVGFRQTVVSTFSKREKVSPEKEG